MKDNRLAEDFFNYEEITEEHKEAATEILNYLDQRDGVSDTLASRLRVKFGIKEPEKQTFLESKMYKLATKFGIYCVQNGYLTEEDGSQVDMLTLEGDINRLDAFLEFATIVMNEQEASETEVV